VGDEPPDPDAERRVNECLESHVRLADAVAESLRRRHRLDPEDARDLSRDALLRVCLAHVVRPYPNVPGALTLAIQNMAVDDWRRRRRIACGVTIEDVECPAPWATDEVRLASEERTLRKIFCSFPEPTKAAMAEWALGTDFAQIGRELGMSEDKARNTVHNALKSARAQLKKRCPPPSP